MDPELVNVNVPVNIILLGSSGAGKSQFVYNFTHNNPSIIGNPSPPKSGLMFGTIEITTITCALRDKISSTVFNITFYDTAGLFDVFNENNTSEVITFMKKHTIHYIFICMPCFRLKSNVRDAQKRFLEKLSNDALQRTYFMITFCEGFNANAIQNLTQDFTQNYAIATNLRFVGSRTENELENYLVIFNKDGIKQVWKVVIDIISSPLTGSPLNDNNMFKNTCNII